MLNDLSQKYTSIRTVLWFAMLLQQTDPTSRTKAQRKLIAYFTNSLLNASNFHIIEVNKHEHAAMYTPIIAHYDRREQAYL